MTLRARFVAFRNINIFLPLLNCVICLFPEDHGSLQTMDPGGSREFEPGPSFGDNSYTQPKTQTKISAQTAKNIESLMRRVEFRSLSSRQETQITPNGHFVINPEIRQTIAHPKYPVRMPDRPFGNLSFYDGSRRDYLN